MRILQKAARAAAGTLCGAAVLTAAGGAATLAASGTAAAGVQALVVPVSGMTCALCKRGVEESVRQVEGVGAVDADLASGRVTVSAVDGRSLNILQVKERVRRAGFKVAGECDVTATGRFHIGPEGRISFRLAGAGTLFQVLEGNELRRMFMAHPGLKGDFLVSFRLHEHPNWKPSAMAVIAFEPVRMAPKSGPS